jgi:hypothetical protein
MLQTFFHINDVRYRGINDEGNAALAVATFWQGLIFAGS